MSSSSDSDSYGNGQTQIEFWASFGFFLLSFVTLVFGTSLWKDFVVRRPWFVKYHNYGLLIHATVVDLNVAVVERKRGGQVLSRRVGRCSVTIEYDAPHTMDDEERIDDGLDVLQEPIVNSASLRRVQKHITSEGRLLYAELMRHSEETSPESRNEGDTPQRLEVLLLPEQAMSAYPRVLVEHELENQVTCATWILLTSLILAVFSLLIVSITIQCRKETWDLDFDIGPIVWMVVGSMAILFLLVWLALKQESKAVFLTRDATWIPVRTAHEGSVATALLLEEEGEDVKSVSGSNTPEGSLLV